MPDMLRQGLRSGQGEARESCLTRNRAPVAAPWLACAARRGWHDFWNSEPFPAEDLGWRPDVQKRYEHWRLHAATVQAAGLRPPPWGCGITPPPAVLAAISKADRAIGSPWPGRRGTWCL